MRIKHRLVPLIICSLGFSINLYAKELNESIYLKQILNQLEAIKPLVLAASKEQPKNMRVQFHYIHYQDMSGNHHNGLLEDIEEIEKGVQARLSQPTTEPHRFAPIKGDYLVN